jgi:hypothetical protein
MRAKRARVRDLLLSELKQAATFSASFLGSRNFSSDIKDGAKRLPLAVNLPRAFVRTHHSCGSRARREPAPSCHPDPMRAKRSLRSPCHPEPHAREARTGEGSASQRTQASSNIFRQLFSGSELQFRHKKSGAKRLPLAANLPRAFVRIRHRRESSTPRIRSPKDAPPLLFAHACRLQPHRIAKYPSQQKVSPPQQTLPSKNAARSTCPRGELTANLGTHQP